MRTTNFILDSWAAVGQTSPRTMLGRQFISFGFVHLFDWEKKWIEESYFKYGNFENGKFDSKLISKILRLVSSKISDANFKLTSKMVISKTLLGTMYIWAHNQSIKSSSQQFGLNTYPVYNCKLNTDPVYSSNKFPKIYQNLIGCWLDLT